MMQKQKIYIFKIKIWNKITIYNSMNILDTNKHLFIIEKLWQELKKRVTKIKFYLERKNIFCTTRAWQVSVATLEHVHQHFNQHIYPAFLLQFTS